jgi:16S rRNA (guanine527-N7)-methyltransferase
MDETLITTLSEGAAAIGIRLGPAELDRFAIYHREILLWNRRINLVSERSAQEIVIRHFLDSLTPAPFLDRPDGALIDLGSGGGFPGIPLRIALPGLQLTLVEASRKKSSFLAHLVRTLRLDGVQVIRERVEELTAGEALAGRYDTLISRAAFKLPDLIRTASIFLKPGGATHRDEGTRSAGRDGRNGANFGGGRDGLHGLPGRPSAWRGFVKKNNNLQSRFPLRFS